LYVRFLGPSGLHVTLYPTPKFKRTYPTPFQVGLRPGYIYRVQVSGFAGHPDVMVFPTLEVRGTLQLPPRLKSADYPAPVVFSNEDLTRVQAGSVLTRVVVLENPERATPAATTAAQPIEFQVPPGQDPLVEARERGRPVLIVRLGQRDFSPEDMARQAIPGTMLLPGDKGLGPAACLPWRPWASFPVYDPILGPRCPEEECLRDGGDHGQPAGINRNGQLQGLDPADTVAEYTDSQGRRRLAVSNCVCICVPRYVAILGETILAGLTTRLAPANATAAQAYSRRQALVVSAQTRQAENLVGLRARERLSGTVNTQAPGRLNHLEVLNAYRVEAGPGALLGTELLHKLTEEQRVGLKRQVELAFRLSQPSGPAGMQQIVPGPAVVGRVQGVNVISTLQETRELTVSCKEAPVPPPGTPLVLHKWADRQAAQVGDVVTLFLKYSNHGGQPITDVAVSDSLTGRLEYVSGSSKSDRDAVFTLQENEAGSVVLRWEIGGTLLPGQSGVVSFQARVR
jgi:uncharacterized repeat protein (TIGR01451 family)